MSENSSQIIEYKKIKLDRTYLKKSKEGGKIAWGMGGIVDSLVCISLPIRVGFQGFIIVFKANIAIRQ